MDRLSELGNTLSNLTMYDIKSMYNQAKNVVLNVSEMEAKVREATNDDPWGASSTLMSEIAQGTFNFQNFNEIMPCIYSQFMEKEAKQWRQIYKALQLLEYLVKHGSERVVDDARSHISTLKMLRSFHYIDDKGKDQGINVRNRSRELVELLSDVEKIRTERRKAKANKSKYTGVGNDGMSFSSGSGRYGGFGSDSLGSSSWSNYDSGSGGYGSRASGYDRDYSGSSGGFRDDSSRNKFEEYDAGEDETPRRSGSTSAPASSSLSTSRAPARSATQPAAQKAPEQPAKVVDLLGFEDDEPAVSVANPMATNKALPTPTSTTDAFDDEFDDFVGAPTSPTSATSAPAAVPVASPTAPAKPNLMDLLNQTAPTSTAARPPMHQAHSSISQSSFGSFGMTSPGPYTPSYGASQFPTANYGAPSSPMGTTSFASQPAMQPMRAASTGTVASPAPSTASKSSGGGFDDLWKSSLGSSNTKTSAPVGPAKSIKDLTKEKAQAGIWGSQQQQQARPQSMGSFGNFGTPAAGSTSASGGDDLLL